MEGLVTLTPGKEKEIHDERRFVLGQLGLGSDGSFYRYVLAGASNVSAGKLVQGPAVGANFDELVTAAAAVGATSIAITNGATAITADMFLNGKVIVEDDAGEGHAYLLGPHPAVDASAVYTATLAPGESVKVAITAATTCALVRNPCAAVIIQPSPPTTKALGVTATALTAGDYGWAQCSGMAPVLTDGVLVVGKSVMASDAIDGAVEDAILAEGTPNTLFNSQIVGVCQEVAADTEHSTILLALL